jgi:flagellin-like hook-associated protein FlgL
MTGPVVLSSTIRTSLLQQSKDPSSLGEAKLNPTLDSQKIAKIKTIENSFAPPTLTAQASELGQSLDTISQGLMILTKTQDALHGLSDLLREASNLLGGKTDPAELAKAFAENTQAIDDFIANSEYAGVNLLDGDEINIITNDTAEPVAIEGRHYNGESLGFDKGDVADAKDLESLKESVRFALDSVQNYGVLISDAIDTIQSRHNFTQSTIDVLKEAAAGFDIKDLSEEGVNLLALQTRQQLANQDISLATKEQSSLLNLF